MQDKALLRIGTLLGHIKSVRVIDPSKNDTLPSLLKEGHVIIEKTLLKRGRAR
jgi:uncharacterized protein YnzC (UPF0291/DUF896 family)